MATVGLSDSSTYNINYISIRAKCPKCRISLASVNRDIMYRDIMSEQRLSTHRSHFAKNWSYSFTGHRNFKKVFHDFEGGTRRFHTIQSYHGYILIWWRTLQWLCNFRVHRCAGAEWRAMRNLHVINCGIAWPCDAPSYKLTMKNITSNLEQTIQPTDVTNDNTIASFPCRQETKACATKCHIICKRSSCLRE
jgi:hypothetical protein